MVQIMVTINFAMAPLKRWLNMYLMACATSFMRHADDHQHACQTGQRHILNDRREQKHHDQQTDRMEDTGQTGLRTRANCYRGTRQSSSRWNAAKHRQHHVADTLCEQLLIVVRAWRRSRGRRTHRTAGSRAR